MRKLSLYLSLSSNSFTSTALDWGISSLQRFRFLVLLARPSCANSNQRRSIPKLYNAFFTLFGVNLSHPFIFTSTKLSESKGISTIIVGCEFRLARTVVSLTLIPEDL